MAVLIVLALAMAGNAQATPSTWTGATPIAKQTDTKTDTKKLGFIVPS
jgi:hypothetical protein